MIKNILDTDIMYLHGVGPKKADVLRGELDIHTFRDLLFYFPYRYEDRSRFYAVNELSSDLPYVQLRGKFVRFETQQTGKNTKKLVGYFADGTGIVEIVWFKGVEFVKRTVDNQRVFVLFGKPSEFGGRINIIHPDIEEYEKWKNNKLGNLYPQYSTTEKSKSSFVTSKTIMNLCVTLFQQVRGHIEETLPQYIIDKYSLMGLEETLLQLHFPKNTDILTRAQNRIKFEELLYIQLGVIRAKILRRQKIQGFVFDRKNDRFLRECFYKKIPFKLTGAQTRVLQEIRQDVSSGKQMNRLLQGDVGSGKTMVALLTMLMAVDNGYQACLMVPTEVLAQQHFRSLQKLLDGIGVSIRLLTGSTKKKERVIIDEELRSGKLNIIVGTHALIEDTVVFNNLGIAVIDEQHRFGVDQRAKLWKKNILPPHILVMTATPIPRTLAMTLYGDLDVSVIDELPAGRSKIITKHFYDSNRMAVFGFMRKQIALGHQVYVVFPLISESENMDYKDLEDGVEGISRAFPIPDYQISVVHGRMKPEDKEFSMRRFERNETQIMIATTVIEVGVDVPNATVMVIESAERFGLSQLHQLRGRVGRGDAQSYCILMTGDKLSQAGAARIETMVHSTDGFEISETDLKLRGPGDLEGKQQSGFAINLKMTNLSQDGKLIQWMKSIAEEILDDDVDLQKTQNQILREQLEFQNMQKKDYGSIS